MSVRQIRNGESMSSEYSPFRRFGGFAKKLANEAPKARNIKAGFSAKGAEYESQGQAPNNVRRVAPGKCAQWP
jgi:hypothetical protein